MADDVASRHCGDAADEAHQRPAASAARKAAASSPVGPQPSERSRLQPPWPKRGPRPEQDVIVLDDDDDTTADGEADPDVAVVGTSQSSAPRPSQTQQPRQSGFRTATEHLTLGRPLQSQELTPASAGSASRSGTVAADVDSAAATAPQKKQAAKALMALFSSAKNKDRERREAALSAATMHMVGRNFKLVTTPPLVDRDSRFIAHAVRGITTAEDAEKIALVVTSSIAPGAAHACMYGFVLPTGQCGFEDDGEQYGGKKIVTTIRDRHRAGSPGWFVGVSRWFGGTLLGPVRFTHIASCTHDAMTLWERTHGSNNSSI